MNFRKGLFVLGVAILGALGTRAQTTWQVGSGNWSLSTNWSSGVPSSRNAAQFDTAATSTIDTNFTINDLVLESGANMMIGTSGGALTVTGGTSDSSAEDNGISANIGGAGTMNVSGGAILNLSGNNTYSGATTITSGTLQAGSTTAFGPTSEVTIAAGGVLALNNYNNTVYSLSGSGSVTLGTGTLTVGGGLGPFINTTFSGVISGSGGFTYNTYDQVLTLTGANTYSGTTTITQGTLEIGNNGTTGSIGSGPIATVVNGYIDFARSDTNTYANVISGSGSVEVANGTVTLTGANTYSEFTDVNSATLIVGTAFNGSSGSLGNGSTNVNLTSGTNPAILDLNNLNTKIGVINGDSSSQLQLGSAALTIQDIAGTDNMAGSITGTGSITMIVGTFNATGNANTYSGGTTINGGTFVALNTLPTSSATGSGPITINGGGGSFLSIGNDTASGYIANLPISDNGVIQFARTDTTTFPNQITGTGSIDVQDGGTVTLTGNNSYTGDTAIDMATLKAGSSTALGSDTALSFNYYGGTLDLNGNNISVGSVTGGSSTYPSYINLGSNTLTIGGIPGTTTLSTIISGTGGITLTGPAEETYLTAIDTYSGPTVIGTGAVLSLGFSSLAGSIPNTSGISGSGTLVFFEPSATTISAPITGSLSVTQISGASGVVTLSGTNTYTGATTINSGTLEAGSASAFGNASPVTINGTGELNLNGFNNTIGPLAGSATSSIVLGGAVLTIDPPADPTFSGVISGGTLALTGPGTEVLDGANTSLTGISIGGTSTLQVGDGATAGASISGNVTDSGALVFEPYSTDNITYGGVISGPGTVTFSGLGQINFSGANTYSGQTSLVSGTLTDGAANSYSPNSVMAVNSGANLQVNYNETVLGLQNGTGAGNVAIASGAVLNSLGGGVGDFDGIISGTMGSILVSAGVQGFAGSNTYGGGTTITNDGEIFVGSNSALGTGTITFEGSGPELSPDANVTLSNPIVLNATFDNDDGGTYSLILTGPISGGSGIEWCAPGVITLTNGANSFTGGIDMREGTLVVTTSGATGNGGAITLDSGTTLDVGSGVTVTNPLNFTGTAAILTGPGTIATPVTANSSAIVAPAQFPGGGPANLTFSGGLAFESGGTIQFDLYDATGTAGVGYSLITVPSGLSFSASPDTLTFNLSSVTSSGSAANAINFNPSTSYSWMFATSSSPITGFNASDFNLVTSGFSNSTGGGTFSLSEGGDNLYLNFTPVPEPSTWALMGAGLVALLVPFAMRRRRLARI
jgi:fibronectin-binding autotransporter adhesin